MNLLILLGLSIAPGIAIALYIYFRDKYEKEPLRFLIITFFLGILSVIPTLFFELALGKNYNFGTENLFDMLVYNFIVIGFTEEFFKAAPLIFYAYPKKDFNEPFDGITYSIMTAMGFATIENIFYVINGGWQVALLRLFTAVPAHATFAILVGYFVGLSKFKKYSVSYITMGIISATIFHGAYDFFLSIQKYPLIIFGAVASLVVGIFLSFKAMKNLSECSPFKILK